MSGRTSKRYPAQLRERAIRTDGEIRADHESEWAAMTQVATLLGVGTSETVVGLQDHPRDLLRAARSPANRRGGQGRAAAAMIAQAHVALGSRLRFVVLRRFLGNANRRSSPSRLTQTTVECGVPSGSSVDNTAKFLPVEEGADFLTEGLHDGFPSMGLGNRRDDTCVRIGSILSERRVRRCGGQAEQSGRTAGLSCLGRLSGSTVFRVDYRR
jgi:hypothetical protein